MIRNTFKSLLFSAAFVLAGSVTTASAQQAETSIEIHWVNLQPDDGLIVDAVVLFFHDGSFDLYEPGSAASPLLAKLAKRQFGDLGTLPPGVKMAGLGNPHDSWQVDAGFWAPVSIATVSLDPTQHRYATAYIALRPSNDAFLGNDDSYRIRLFDLAGNAELPVVVDFGGGEVMDAGICVNDEAKLQFLDVKEMTAQTCVAENGVVRRHPGFNGSVRNPAGTPKRILGGAGIDMGGNVGERNFDTSHADFSIGGTQIGRLVFLQRDAAFSITGSYYDPARAGEGFNIEVFRPQGADAYSAVVYWYTFEPGTGKPLWLVGSGGLHDSMVLHSASGGSMNSESNPENVVRTRWGTLRLGTTGSGGPEPDWCNGGLVVYYVPDNALIPAGRYPVQRLTPRGDAAQALCNQLYPPTRIY